MAPRISEEQIESIASECHQVAETMAEVKKYGGTIPVGWGIEIPSPNTRINASVGPTRFMAYTKMFEYGVRLPLDEFVQELLRECRLAPSQINPNGWAHIYAFLHFCRSLGHPAPSVALFSRYFYLVRSKSFVGFAARKNKALSGKFTHIDSSVKLWKERFFVISFSGMNIPTEWDSSVRSADFLERPIAADEEQFCSVLEKADPVRIKLMARGIGPDGASLDQSATMGRKVVYRRRAPAQGASSSSADVSKKGIFAEMLRKQMAQREAAATVVPTSSAAVGSTSAPDGTNSSPRIPIIIEEEEEVPEEEALVRRKKQRAEAPPAPIDRSSSSRTSSGPPPPRESTNLPPLNVKRLFHVPPADSGSSKTQQEILVQRVARVGLIPVGPCTSDAPSGLFPVRQTADSFCRSLGFPDEMITSSDRLATEVAARMTVFPQDEVAWKELSPAAIFAQMENLSFRLFNQLNYAKRAYALDFHTRLADLTGQLEEAKKSCAEAEARALSADKAFAEQSQKVAHLEEKMSELVTNHEAVVKTLQGDAEEERKAEEESLKARIEDAVYQSKIDMIEFLPQCLPEGALVDFNKLQVLIAEKEKKDAEEEAARIRSEEKGKDAASS